jgi:ABC-type transporter Mla subunit MlaD
MPRPTTYAENLKQWELLSKSLAANAGGLPHLEAHRAQLDALLAQAKDLAAQQANLTATKQEVSKHRAELNAEGRKLTTFLQVAVKQQYGNRAEKLLEFGVQPLRSQPRIKLVGPDGQPLKKRKKAQPEPAEPATP